jgi:methionyl aminopeptidase
MRHIPDHIPKPDYYSIGYPAIEIASRQQITAKIHSERDIAGIREACLIGRQVLDAAHAAVRPGITTDEIDRIVSPCCRLQLLPSPCAAGEVLS